MKVEDVRQEERSSLFTLTGSAHTWNDCPEIPVGVAQSHTHTLARELDLLESASDDAVQVFSLRHAHSIAGITTDMQKLVGVQDKITVLDHGFVHLVDLLGSDQMICDAARLSYAYATRKMTRDDAKLIDYLLEHHHTSPFEQVVFTFHAKMPIFVARQWVRHRTARLNELSGRYSEMPEEYYIPELDQLKIQSKTNNQGRGDEQIADAALCQNGMRDIEKQAFNTYHALLEAGMTKELARTVLPLSTYTEWYWQMDLNNLFKFLYLRCDSHAQYEIRVYADAIYKLIQPYVPMACESFERHMLNAQKFSSDEMQILRDLIHKLLDANETQLAVELMRQNPVFESSNDRKIKGFFKKLGIEIA